MKRKTVGLITTTGAALGIVVLQAALRKKYSFRNKSVVITGGSRGLGLEMARLFAQEGANVALIARTQETLERARIELENMGSSVLAIRCDVRDRGQVEAAIAEVVRHFGSVDVLVNNAGIIQVGPYDRMQTDDYENVMATHAWGPLYMTKAALPHMRRMGGGRIVNISSIGGKVAVPHLLPYTMSKFALTGLSQGMSAELAQDGILVTTVCPGLMRTGSHINASFKGRNRNEYAWFSISGALPLVSIDATRAARKIVEACRRGRPDLTITPQAKVIAMANAIMPALMVRAMRIANALLPGPGAESASEEHKGFESTSELSPSLLTRLSDNAADRNNETFHRRLAG
jgi:NAD(P)-dependent dehydrogenase (short-subunit alcohol dehydrogenase family)